MLEQYKEAIQNSNIVSKTDIDGIITFVNDEFCNISGYSRSELIGQNHNIVRHPDIDENIFKLLWDTIKSKQTYKATVQNLAKDGSSFYVNTTVTPILDENGNIIEYIAIRYDVTKEVILKEQLFQKEIEYEELNKTLEKRVAKQTKELKELNKTLEKRVEEEISKNEKKQRVMFWQSRHASLGQMLANIAHQWRQPLTELNLAMFSIKKAAKNENLEDLSKFYNESKNIIKNMSNTIDDFTNFFTPQKEKHYFNINDSIKESIGLLDKIINEEMINIKTDFIDIEVLGVTNELTQVIINLITNSKDAFISNSILIKEINISIKKRKNFALIEIQDNAGGISKTSIDKIFEPYFTTKHKSRGTGLGLFMSKMICEQGLNGTIDVKSRKRTTTFSIKIPLENNEK
ncbi:MAG: PAS domain-containing sensor histidine kinase [Sulfurimonas sp.]|nr:PAS domain-containing sensor histidine kinase [Sulfurimonas sp.]